MAQFTVLTRQEVEHILERYNLGRLLSFAPLDGGLANSSVKLETECGRFVLSVCDEKEMDETSRLCEVLLYLEKYNFPTTRVVAAGDGAPCVGYQGKPLYIKHYIEGGVVKQLGLPQLFEVGAALAGLHEIPPYPGLLEKFSYGLECFDELKGRASSERYYGWLSTCRTRVEEARTEALPKGFVHGDLFFDNMVFSDGSLAALLDFEEACHYYRIFDIGMTAVGCCAPDTNFSLEMTAALVDGYQSIRKLEANERRLLQLHVEYGAAATSFWRYRQYNIRNPDPDMKDHYRAMMEIAIRVNAIDAGLFVERVFREHGGKSI